MPLVRDYTDSELVNLLSDKAEILFARLLLKVDTLGNYTADPVLIKSYCFQRKDIRINQLSTWIKELAQVRLLGPSKKPAALIRLYEVSGKQYLHVYNYGQKLKWKKPVYPPPPEVEDEVEEETEDEAEVEGAPMREYISTTPTAKDFFSIEKLKIRCEQDQLWWEERGIEFSKTKEEIFLALEKFNTHLRGNSDKLKTEIDYRSHFRNWFRKNKDGNNSKGTNRKNPNASSAVITEGRAFGQL